MKLEKRRCSFNCDRCGSKLPAREVLIPQKLSTMMPRNCIGLCAECGGDNAHRIYNIGKAVEDIFSMGALFNWAQLGQAIQGLRGSLPAVKIELDGLWVRHENGQVGCFLENSSVFEAVCGKVHRTVKPTDEERLKTRTAIDIALRKQSMERL